MITHPTAVRTRETARRIPEMADRLETEIPPEIPNRAMVPSRMGTHPRGIPRPTAVRTRRTARRIPTTMDLPETEIPNRAMVPSRAEIPPTGISRPMTRRNMATTGNPTGTEIPPIQPPGTIPRGTIPQMRDRRRMSSPGSLTERRTPNPRRMRRRMPRTTAAVPDPEASAPVPGWRRWQASPHWWRASWWWCSGGVEI